MSIKLEDLPFQPADLEPYIAAETVELHHGGHQKGYVDKVNSAISDTEYDSMSLPQIVASAVSNGDTKIFQNSAQAWNHAFYWSCMSPDGRRTPEGQLADQIKTDFGSLEEFHEAFLKEAKGVFGSGWAWLVWAKDKLKIVGTSNADIPMEESGLALYCCDVWEHAYYLDYQKDRGKYIKDCLDHLHDWRVTEARFELRHSASTSLDIPVSINVDD